MAPEQRPTNPGESDDWPRDRFWASRKVLITGHTGFKGSWLALWLQHLGASVHGYSLGFPTTPSLYEAAGVSELVASEEGDVADLEHLAAVVAQHQPEVVFHLAAQSLVRRSYDDPLGTFRTNVMGTVTLLEAVRRAGGVRVVLNVTSDKCYRNKGWDWGYRETDELGGSDPYSSSKACAELVSTAYGKSFFGSGGSPALASVRAGNVIGGGDWAADRLIPDIVRATRQAGPLLVRHPHAVRPWQHVLDCLDGYLLLAERMWWDPGTAGAWNFGPDDSSTRSVGWMVRRMTALLGAGGTDWRSHSPGDERYEAAVLRLDSSRARMRLGWRPKLSIEAATQLTADWYRSFYDGGDARRATFDQLGAHGAHAHGAVL